MAVAADKGVTMAIAAPDGLTLLAALTRGDTRIQTSFKRTLSRAVEESSSGNTLRMEELEALAGLAEGFGQSRGPKPPEGSRANSATPTG